MGFDEGTAASVDHKLLIRGDRSNSLDGHRRHLGLGIENEDRLAVDGWGVDVGVVNFTNVSCNVALGRIGEVDETNAFNVVDDVARLGKGRVVAEKELANDGDDVVVGLEGLVGDDDPRGGVSLGLGEVDALGIDVVRSEGRTEVVVAKEARRGCRKRDWVRRVWSGFLG